ncbi:MAG TPA: LytTR family DNA-binding domain-containing protein [Sphingobacteriaceae bacterium]
MRILIVEDESLAGTKLAGMLKKVNPEVEVAGVLPSVRKSIDFLRSGEEIDLILMDIHLEDDDCFKIFEQINLQVPVIFTTAYDKYVLQAFKVNSIDYLMKPIVAEELKAALDKYKKVEAHYIKNDISNLLHHLKSNNGSYKDRFLVTTGLKMRSIPIEEVRYFQLIDKITFMVTEKNELLPVEYSLDKLSRIVSPKKFFRVNRRTTVGMNSISSVHLFSKGKLKLELMPPPTEKVFVSMDRTTAFKEWLGK